MRKFSRDCPVCILLSQHQCQRCRSVLINPLASALCFLLLRDTAGALAAEKEEEQAAAARRMRHRHRRGEKRVSGFTDMVPTPVMREHAFKTNNERSEMRSLFINRRLFCSHHSLPGSAGRVRSADIRSSPASAVQRPKGSRAHTHKLT